MRARNTHDHVLPFNHSNPRSHHRPRKLRLVVSQDRETGREASGTKARGQMRPPVDTLVTDVEHTLVDWTRAWASATRAMIKALDLTGVTKAAFVSALRESYERHQTLDAPAALEDAGKLVPQISVRDLCRAAEVYRSEADRGLAVYPGVRSALAAIKRSGARVVAYTDAPPALTRARLERSGLSQSIDLLICSRQDPHQPSDRRLSLGMPDARTSMRGRVVTPAATGASEPEIGDIVREHAPGKGRVLVIGDHPDKDITPALACRCRAAWARYGMEREPADHALITALCQWSMPRLRPSVVPDGVPALERFDDVLSMFRWTRAKSA